jgi:hypothetical protein
MFGRFCGGSWGLGECADSRRLSFECNRPDFNS